MVEAVDTDELLRVDRTLCVSECIIRRIQKEQVRC